MARRRLTAPTEEALKELEDGFAARPDLSGLGSPAPIAQVAGEAAALAAAGVPDRERAARDSQDAEALRQARETGRMIEALPLQSIDSKALVRDRLTFDVDAMDELVDSIRQNGLRLPIEVYELENPKGAARYGLISGYRRFAAMSRLYGDTGDTAFAVIPALVRERKSFSEALIAMVEENEIRSDLSHYERGRIAVLAASQGAFADTEAAIASLFSSASKAKRSKIRSFATIHEELGDVLLFAPKITERDGLKIAAALRDGSGGEMRQLLASGIGTDADSELAAMRSVMEAQPIRPRSSLGGRPRRVFRSETSEVVQLSEFLAVQSEQTDDGRIIRFTGPAADERLIREVMIEIERLFGVP